MACQHRPDIIAFLSLWCLLQSNRDNFHYRAPISRADATQQKVAGGSDLLVFITGPGPQQPAAPQTGDTGGCMWGPAHSKHSKTERCLAIINLFQGWLIISSNTNGQQFNSFVPELSLHLSWTLFLKFSKKQYQNIINYKILFIFIWICLDRLLSLPW